MTTLCDISQVPPFSDWQLLAVDESLAAGKNSETQVKLSREFHSRARHCSISVGEHLYRCEWTFEKDYAETYIELQSHDAVILVAVESMPSITKASERGWWEYSGDVRWLAWAIEHDILISIFQNLFTVKLQPKSSTVIPEAIESYINLRWRFIGDNARFEGTALVDATLLTRLLANNHWITNVPPKLRWELRSTLSIEMPMGELAVSELAASGTGDLLLIGNVQTPNDFVTVRLLTYDHYWVATPNEQRYTLCSAPLMLPIRKTIMTHEQYTPSTPTEDTSSPRMGFLSVEQLQVQLALQLGAIEIPLGELEQLQPGYVITLPHPPNHLTPTLLANGQAIGRGELVTLGNQLGVRITEWKSNGL